MNSLTNLSDSSVALSLSTIPRSPKTDLDPSSLSSEATVPNDLVGSIKPSTTRLRCSTLSWEIVPFQ